LCSDKICVQEMPFQTSILDFLGEVESFVSPFLERPAHNLYFHRKQQHLSSQPFQKGISLCSCRGTIYFVGIHKFLLSAWPIE
jgi:hypothetical protein